MKISGNEVRPGMVILHKDQLWVAVKIQHTQPGKGGAYLQVELKNLQTNSKLNERFRSSESVERAHLEQKVFQFLYKEDDSNYVFMDKETFEQITLGEELVDKRKAAFLREGLEITVEFYDGKVISFSLPTNMVFEVSETEAVIKGQTASSSFKPAILENGVRTMVPLHIEAGTKIVLNTEDETYVEKAK